MKLLNIMKYRKETDGYHQITKPVLEPGDEVQHESGETIKIKNLELNYRFEVTRLEAYYPNKEKIDHDIDNELHNDITKNITNEPYSNEWDFVGGSETEEKIVLEIPRDIEPQKSEEDIKEEDFLLVGENEETKFYISGRDAKCVEARKKLPDFGERTKTSNVTIEGNDVVEDRLDTDL